MNKVVAVTTENGSLLCGTCATEYADYLGLHPREVEDWEPMTEYDMVETAKYTYRSIKHDAIHQYPDFVEAGIDPFLVAQMDSVPHCDRCGRFLARPV